MLKMLLILFALTVTLTKKHCIVFMKTRTAIKKKKVTVNQLDSYGPSAAFETTPMTYL